MLCPHCEKPIDVIDVEFNFEAGTIRSGSRTIRATDRQIEVLEHLLDAHPRILEIQQLYSDIWSDLPDEEMPTLNALYNVINRLQKLFDETHFPICIATVRHNGASGYLLTTRSQNAERAIASAI